MVGILTHADYFIKIDNIPFSSPITTILKENSRNSRKSKLDLCVQKNSAAYFKHSVLENCFSPRLISKYSFDVLYNVICHLLSRTTS